MILPEHLRYKQDIERLDENSSHKKIIEFINNDSVVLDVGCACGDIGSYLYKNKNCTMYGIEYCKESIDIALKNDVYTEILHADLNIFEPQEHYTHIKFDKIIFGDILEHLYNPKKILNDFSFLLKPDGEIIVSLPNIAHASIVIQLLLNNFKYMDYGILDKTHIRFFSLENIAELFTELSFEVKSADHVIYDIYGFHEHLQKQTLQTSLITMIAKNPHAFVLQYVFVASKCNDTIKHILQKNKTLLGQFSKESLRLIAYHQNKFDFPEKTNELDFFSENIFERFFFQQVKPLARNILSRQIWNGMKGIRNRVRRARRFFSSKQCLQKYAAQILSIPTDSKQFFVPQTQQKMVPAQGSPKAIAFYLPQFHTFTENNLWWGRGFTEWTNVAKAVPQFINHYQPRLPIDVGYYDLNVPGVMHRQVELAKMYGLSGFCFHYYWFSGKRLMELPANKYLADSTLSFPFCFCWANEPWTRRWDGSENDILIGQDLLEKDDRQFIEDINSFFMDSRYITVDGKPLLIIYRPHLWSRERVLRLTENMRKTAVNMGHKGLYLVAALSHDFFANPEKWGFDAGIEFPPHLSGRTPLANVEFINNNFVGSVHEMRSLVAASKKREYSFPVFRTVFPSWDNTARKNDHAYIFHHCSPKLYKEWLSSMLTYTFIHNKPSTQYVFINAWNEWAEGAYLEPDRKYGYAYLQATGEALLDFQENTNETNN